MTASKSIRPHGSVVEQVATAATTRLIFAGRHDFQAVLRRRVDEYFARTGERERDCPQMYVKTAILLGATALLYALLVFFATTWWQAVPLILLLAFAAAGIGFNIQHDGGHHAYSKRPWVNKLMSMTLDLMGGSSYWWRWKHGIFHHTYTNIEGHDTDIDLQPLGRLSPHQPLRKLHRFQHWYLWLLYGFTALRWHFYGDFRDLLSGTVGDHKVPRPKGWELVLLFGGKLVFFGLTFGIPFMRHSVWVVLGSYALFAMVLGILLSVVFQLAHCVEEAGFPLPAGDGVHVENAWAIHQIETTVDFARDNKLAAWYLGGLNFQIEHHLFPRISHLHYPKLATLVEQTCREFGVRYTAHPTVWDGVVSHFHFLKRLGMPQVEAAGVA